MSVVLAGPWIGEFGWELFCWQGYLRKLSKSGKKVIVVSQESRRVLYQDFYHDFIPFDYEGSEVDAFKCHDFSDQDSFNKIKSQIEHDEYLDPRKGIVFYYNNNPSLCKNFDKQEFHKYGSKTKDGYDIIIHARSTEKCGTYFRNWPIDKWEGLISKLKGLNIASIGSSNGAMHVNGTENLIDTDLKDIANIMRNSKLIVGPSSGPMHFASLCGLDQVVWSEMKNEKKYKKDWNPFGTKVFFHSGDSWNPNVDTAYDLIRKALA